MVLSQPGGRRLDSLEMPKPAPGPSEVLVKVLSCGVCRTDLHVVDGELPDVAVPIVPGHEIVGRVAAVGRDVTEHAIGDRVGIPWLAWSCGTCEFCRAGRENLCPRARYTGYQVNGGYAEFAIAGASYCFPVPERFDDS